QKMFELLGDKAESAATEARVVMRIETELAKGSMSRLDRRDPNKLYHKLAADEFEHSSPAFQWQTYFAKVRVPSLKTLNVTAPDYCKTVSETLDKEDVGSLKSYLRWKLVNANAPYLSSAFVNEDFNFYGKTLEGREHLPPRWKRCTEDVDNDIGEALGQAYVAKYFSPQAKAEALQMVKQIE